MSDVVTESVSKPTRHTWRVAARLGIFAAGSVVLGAAAGVLWWLLVTPPAYEVNSNGGATTSERGLTEFIAADAWFCAIGLVAGLLIGLAAWRWLRALGWTIVAAVLLCAVASALTCWLVGYRARASLLVWPFFAIIPVLLGSSLGRDDEEPRPLLRRRARSGHQAQ
jgi:hypothetical protein